MFSIIDKKTARKVLENAPLITSAVLLIGMMISGLSASPRAMAQAAGTAATQAKPASRASGGLSMISAPNHNYSPAKSRRVDTIVMHFISGINVNRNRWDDSALARKILTDNRVSAHYLIARNGTAYKLVDEHNIAWHAGGSIMPTPDNRKNVNRFSIGIEIIATKKSGFTDAQYDTLAKLVSGIKSRYPIRNIVGHDEIAGRRAVGMGLRKDLKEDPGPLFDWGRVSGR